MDKGKNMLNNTSRSVMAKKFKLNDGAQKYVEQATLLEPANVSTSNQNEREEIQEVAFQLALIKKKHDEARKLAQQREDELTKVRKEIEQLHVQEVTAEGPTQAMNDKIASLQESLEETKVKTDEEYITKHRYLHMLQRMKKDFIAAKIMSSENDAAYKNKSAVLHVEESKQRKIKEERLQSKAIFEGLMKNIEKEQRDRQERIHELQKCIRNKEESVQKRIERQRRNQEIAEAAANENKDQSEVKMRENLYIQKLWNSFMKKKMEKEMRNSAVINDAFKDIKTATGVTDVGEMVKKFLTREQTYSQLLVNVSESDQKFDRLQKDNDELRQRLNDINVGDSQNQQENKTDNELEKFQDEDILEMRATISQQDKDYQMLQEKFKKVNIVNDQISGWAKRVYLKFGTLTDDATVQNMPTDMVKVFSTMEQITVGELKSLREDVNRVEPDDAFVDLDFATEDFINKNIRVRPISGTTQHGDDAKTHATHQEDNQEDAQENYNKLAIFEIETQRKSVKKKKEEYLAELQRLKALEEKKAQKK